MKDKGFTLVELLVVFAIVIFLSAIILPNYQGGDEQFALQRSTYRLGQDIRRAQELAMSSQEFEGAVPQGGYGIYFVVGNDYYILFADCDGDGEYDESGGAADCASATPGNQYPEKVGDDISLETEIRINALSPISPLGITFTPPDPTISISGGTNTAEIELSLKTDSSQTKTIFINKAGLIEID